MTSSQKKTFTRVLLALNVDEMHHGGALGADEWAHEIAAEQEIPLIVHPCFLRTDYAFLKRFPARDFRAAKKPLDRNHDIVAESDVVVACPRGFHEVPRGSGTWATIRYTKKARKELIIIWPDGSASRQKPTNLQSSRDV